MSKTTKIQIVSLSTGLLTNYYTPKCINPQVQCVLYIHVHCGLERDVVDSDSLLLQ